MGHKRRNSTWRWTQCKKFYSVGALILCGHKGGHYYCVVGTERGIGASSMGSLYAEMRFFFIVRRGGGGFQNICLVACAPDLLKPY